MKTSIKIPDHWHTLDCKRCLKLAEDYRRQKPIIQIRTVDKEVIKAPAWVGALVFVMILWTISLGVIVYHQQQPIFPEPDVPRSESAFIQSSGTITGRYFETSEWKEKCQNAWKILQHPQTSKERLAFMILDQ